MINECVQVPLCTRKSSYIKLYSRVMSLSLLSGWHFRVPVHCVSWIINPGEGKDSQLTTRKCCNILTASMKSETPLSQCGRLVATSFLQFGVISRRGKFRETQMPRYQIREILYQVTLHFAWSSFRLWISFNLYFDVLHIYCCEIGRRLQKTRILSICNVRKLLLQLTMLTCILECYLLVTVISPPTQSFLIRYDMIM